MGSVIELNISDEKYAVLEELAEQRDLSLKALCNKIVINCLCRYRKEKDPLPDIDIKALIQSDPEFFALLYGESLKEDRVRKAKVSGNLIELAKPTTRLTSDI